LDQYIIVPDFRFRHFAETYCALVFITIDDECLHGLFSSLMVTAGTQKVSQGETPLTCRVAKTWQNYAVGTGTNVA